MTYRLSSFYVDPIAAQLALLNLMVFAYFCCVGIGWVSRVFFRRSPPRRKSINGDPARPR